MPPHEDLAQLGREMHALAGTLYPLCRSLTGEGFRQTLELLQPIVPLQAVEIPSGTRVHDWVVPPEWNVRDAWVKGPDGRKLIDFHEHNLHLVSYSVPFHGTLTREELLPHLHSLPDHPDWIPYRTSYYDATWGFGVADRVKQQLSEGVYEVLVDTTLESGSMRYGEFEIQGATTEEVLISCHGCHPSLANDNLSGLVVLSHLARLLTTTRRRYTYRFLVLPGTIGAVAWLARHEDQVQRIRHGLVLSCLGDRGGLSYKQSRRGDAVIDRAARHIVGQRRDHRVLPFVPFGYDERQYCSPGYDLPVGRLSRTPNGMFEEYHTSADDMDFITAEGLADSLGALVEIVAVLEANQAYVSTNPKCEPQLSRRGLSGPIDAHPERERFLQAVLWVLNLSDGHHQLLDVAERSNLPFRLVREAAGFLSDVDLLRPA